MTTHLAPAPAAATQLGKVALVGAAGLAIGAVHRLFGIGIPCPFLALTGWWCPFCGGTRMVSSVLGGDVLAALHHNPVLFAIAVAVGIRTIGYAVELATKAEPRRWLPRVLHERADVVLLAVAIVFTIARNVLR